ncbi:hypothetical protein GCM10023083_50870 [Streptomyces phyllanthi]
MLRAPVMPAVWNIQASPAITAAEKATIARPMMRRVRLRRRNAEGFRREGGVGTPRWWQRGETGSRVRNQALAYTHVSSHIRDRQSSIGMGWPVYRGKK